MKKQMIDWSALAELTEELRHLTYELERAVERKDVEAADDLCEKIRGEADQTYYLFNEEDVQGECEACGKSVHDDEAWQTTEAGIIHDNCMKKEEETDK